MTLLIIKKSEIILAERLLICNVNDMSIEGHYDGTATRVNEL